MKRKFVLGLLGLILLAALLPQMSVVGKRIYQVVETTVVEYLPLISSSRRPTQPTPTTTPGPTQPPPQVDGMILVDHRSIGLFEQIPDEYIQAARNIRMVFSDRSVGQNINEALDCLDSDGWVDSPSSCRRDYITEWTYKTFTRADQLRGDVPDVINFEASTLHFDRVNWDFEFRMGNWYNLTNDFITNLAPEYLGSKDVLTYQFSYLNVAPDDIYKITDPNDGFFGNTRYADIYDLEAFLDQNPTKIFIFWTTSLDRSSSSTATEFNNMMREYTYNRAENPENYSGPTILFDVADILSHAPDGSMCYDNRDGVEYCKAATGECENHPNDGRNEPAICQEYTTDVNGGHLGSVSGGKIQIAKAFWVLMAQIAGWQP